MAGWHGGQQLCGGKVFMPYLTRFPQGIVIDSLSLFPIVFRQQGDTNKMSDKTLTRMDLSEAVFREVGLSRNESADLVESVLKHMSDALVDGQTVKISSFGTFSVRSKTARVGRNPKTGEEVPITPRRVLTFRPSHLMKDRVDAGNGS